MKIKFCFLCYKGISSIKNHLRIEHNNFNVKDYYDKFLKKDTDGFCLNCNKPIEFNYTKIQYNAYCSNYCMKHSEVYKQRCSDGVKKVWKIRTNCEKELIFSKGIETFNSRTDEQKEKTNIKYKTTWSFKTKEELNAIHSKQLKNRRTYKYKYFGISFHSYDEMSFYIYNVECENNVVYRNDGDFCLPYEFNDKIYFYYPDFIIDNKIIEIKGLQFFKDKNPNNVMICPFHKKDDTLETIENRNKKAESKHQCMLRNNVEIITDCSKYMQYTKSKYGNKVVIGE